MHAQSKHGELHESHFTSILFFLDSLNCCFVLFNTGHKKVGFQCGETLKLYCSRTGRAFPKYVEEGQDSGDFEWLLWQALLTNRNQVPPPGLTEPGGAR